MAIFDMTITFSFARTNAASRSLSSASSRCLTSSLEEEPPGPMGTDGGPNGGGWTGCVPGLMTSFFGSNNTGGVVAGGLADFVDGGRGLSWAEDAIPGQI